MSPLEIVTVRIGELIGMIEVVRDNMEKSRSTSAIKKYEKDLVRLLELKDINNIIYMHIKVLQ